MTEIYILKEPSDKFRLKDNWYGEYLIIKEPVPFDLRIDNKFAKLIAHMIKERILYGFAIPPTRIEEEEVIHRPTFYDKEINKEFIESVGWKAKLYWDEKA